MFVCQNEKDKLWGEGGKNIKPDKKINMIKKNQLLLQHANIYHYSVSTNLALQQV
jgi:hypothetical protein